MTPVDTSPEALAAAREREAAAEERQREAAEAAAVARQAWLRADSAADMARLEAGAAHRARAVLSALQDSMPGTAARLPDGSARAWGWAYRTPAGLPMYLPAPGARSLPAPSAACVGPGPELEGRVPSGRKWRTLAELGPHQQVVEWRLRG